MRVWRAEPHEAAEVARLMIAFRDHMGRDWPAEETFHAGVARLIAHPDAEYLLAAAAGGAPAVGACQLRYRHALWYDAEDCWLEDLYVVAEARGAGVGRALVVAAMERARERGCRRIGLDCSDDNEPALALYRDLGFATGKHPGARDLYFMALL